MKTIKELLEMEHRDEYSPQEIQAAVEKTLKTLRPLEFTTLVEGAMNGLSEDAREEWFAQFGKEVVGMIKERLTDDYYKD